MTTHCYDTSCLDIIQPKVSQKLSEHCLFLSLNASLTGTAFTIGTI